MAFKAGDTPDDGFIIREGPVAVQFLKIVEYFIDVIQEIGAQRMAR